MDTNYVENYFYLLNICIIFTLIFSVFNIK